MSKAVEAARKEVDEAETQLGAKRAALNRIENLTTIYPDLERFEGRWKRVVHRSALANEKVTDVFFRYNCGCCEDSPLEAWPFVKTEHGEVYSNPAYFNVGEKHYVSGARPDRNWETRMREARISEVVIERVRARFEADRRDRIAIVTDDEPSDDNPGPAI